MTSRGGSVEIIHESATYDEYLGTWNENDRGLQGNLFNDLEITHIENNYNDVELLRQRARTNETFVRFYRICDGGLYTTQEERESLMLNSFSREYFRDNGLIVVYEYKNRWLFAVFCHASQHSDWSKRPTSPNKLTVQHLVEYRSSRAESCGGEFEGKV